jgi:hypothetical protein
MPAGNIADIAVALQAAKGTASVVSSHRTYLLSGGIEPVPTVNDVEETSSTRLRQTAYVASVVAEGEPSIAARPGILGMILYGIMGAKGVAGAGDPWTHTFTLAPTTPYLTFWRMLGAALFERFADCKITSLNLESTSGGLLVARFGVVGLAPVSKTAAEATAAVEVTVPFTHMDGKGQFLVETVPVSAIRRIALSLTGGTEAQYGDAVTPDTADEGLIEATLETEQTIANFAEWNRFHYGTTTPADNTPHTQAVIELAGSGVDFKWTKRDAAGVAAVPERSLQVTGTRVQIAAIEGQEANPDGAPLTRTVRYKIYQPAGGASGLTAILKNGVAAYAAS